MDELFRVDREEATMCVLDFSDSPKYPIGITVAQRGALIGNGIALTAAEAIQLANQLQQAVYGKLEQAADAAHQRFTVSETAYLANLDKQDREAPTFAVHFSKSERSMIWPVLILSNYLTDPKDTAKKIAAILNQHWVEEGERAEDQEGAQA